MPFSHALMALRDTPRRFASTACFISRWLRSCCKRSPNIWFTPLSMYIIAFLLSDFSCKNNIKVLIAAHLNLQNVKINLTFAATIVN